MILLTVDTSPASENAVATAVDLARNFKCPLHVLLVLDGPLRHHFNQLADESESTADAAAEGYLATVADTIRTQGLDDVATSHVYGVDAAETIIGAANELGAALIVMGTHGRSGLSRFLAGSVTSQVIRDSTVPVVAVPARAK